MNLTKIITIVTVLFLIVSCSETKSDYRVVSEVPDLIIPENNLRFKEIEDYKNYKIIGTHFRTDKKELRYILANDVAFKAYNENSPFPNGSKIVKIGWNTEEMQIFSPAIEAKEVQRIEYMIKDDKQFSGNPGNWGYARFVKKEGKYKSWDKGTASCISCHTLAKDNGYVFTKFQKLQ